MIKVHVNPGLAILCYQASNNWALYDFMYNLRIRLVYLGKRYKTVADKVASVKRDEIRGLGDHHLEMVPFRIPSLPPTMKSCSCIKISYELKVFKDINFIAVI